MFLQIIGYLKFTFSIEVLLAVGCWLLAFGCWLFMRRDLASGVAVLDDA